MGNERSAAATAVVALCAYEAAAAVIHGVLETRFPPSILGVMDRAHAKAAYHRVTPPGLRIAGWLAVGAVVGVAGRAVHEIRHHPR